MDRGVIKKIVMEDNVLCGDCNGDGDSANDSREAYNEYEENVKDDNVNVNDNRELKIQTFSGRRRRGERVRLGRD